MEQNYAGLHARSKRTDLSWLLFLVSAILSVITTYYVSKHYIDSDTSSELILAKHWIETGSFLSQDWLYGSELRLLHVQLIYVPLMLLTDNWQIVRYAGALIMQVLYIASFACLVSAAGKDRRFFFRGAALLLLPVSVTYGRIVLYHNHYLPNITISFLLLALSMGFMDKVNWHSPNTWLRLFLLAGLSFGGGLNSIRQLMITHAPLLLTAVVLCWIEDAKNENCTETALLHPRNLNFLFCGIYSAAFSFLGMKVQGFLCSRLGIQIAIHSENNRLSFEGLNNIKSILYGFFHQFGYRDSVPMLSVNGILALGGIFTGCYLVYILVCRLLCSDPSQNKRATVLSVFFLAYLSVMTLIFLVTRSSDPVYYYPLYLSLCFPWAVPALLTSLEELPAAVHPLRVKKLFLYLSVTLLLFSGCVNISYFQGSERFPQIYEGLGFQNRNKKAELCGAVEYLVQHGFDKGYADHWECNIVTEMTNGELPMVTVNCVGEPDRHNGNLYYARYLYALWLRESPCEKPFLLLTEDGEKRFLQSDSFEYCTKIYADNHHVVYSIDRLEEFSKTLYS